MVGTYYKGTRLSKWQVHTLHRGDGLGPTMKVGDRGDIEGVQSEGDGVHHHPPIAAAVGCGRRGNAACMPSRRSPGHPGGHGQDHLLWARSTTSRPPYPAYISEPRLVPKRYFANVNSKGGVNGRKSVVDAKDSTFSSGIVANETKEIAANDFALVGGFSLTDGARQPVTEANEVPTVPGARARTRPQMCTLVQKNGDLGEASGPYKSLPKKCPKVVKVVGSVGSNATTSAVVAQKSIDRAADELGRVEVVVFT
jgi:hypothetical protein